MSRTIKFAKRGDGPSGKTARRTSTHRPCEGVQKSQEVSWHKNPFGTDLGMGVNGSGGWKGRRSSRSPYLLRTPMRKVFQKKSRPMCEHVAFLPVGSTGSRASTTIARSPTSHRTDGANF